MKPRILLLLPLFFPSSALAATLSVGPGKTYAKPCAAIAVAQPGDVIEVDASGNYDGDTCAWSTDNLTVRGVGGRAKIDLTGVTPAQQKGIFTITAPNATIENFELSGAAISRERGQQRRGHSPPGPEPHGDELLLPRQPGRHPRRAADGRAGQRRHRVLGVREQRRGRRLLAQHVPEPLRELHAALLVLARREGRSPREDARVRELHPLQPHHRRDRHDGELRDRHPERRHVVRHRKPHRAGRDLAEPDHRHVGRRGHVEPRPALLFREQHRRERCSGAARS